MSRPIIMTGTSPAAILNGTKTMTRRVIDPQPEHSECGKYFAIGQYFWPTESKWRLKWDDKDGLLDEDMQRAWGKYCPYGQVGDRLWVQEAFHVHRDGTITYMANMDLESDNYGLFWKLCGDGLQHEYWVTEFQHPADMLYEQSRMRLEITSIVPDCHDGEWGWAIGYKMIED